MRRMGYLGLLALVLAFILTAAPVFSQDETMASPAGEESAIYGEVKSVDAAACVMQVQYYDYDSDDEKTVEIKSDKETKMENAQSVADIKEGDWVDAIYVSDGIGNIAKSIIVEKEEDFSGQMQEGMPEEE